MKGYIIVWQGKCSKEWNALGDVWPDRTLAEAQMAIKAYQNGDAINYRILEIELPVIAPEPVA